MTSARRPAPTDHPILDVIADRWSPRTIDPDRTVPRAALLRLLEAARWAPSSGNAQPWRYLVFDASVPEARETARACLNEGNAWALAAPVLLLSTARTTRPASGDKPERPNPSARHDVGAATMALSLQAVAEGLVVHQMAGYDRERARTALGLPDDVDPVAMIAVGWPGDVDTADEALRERDARARTRTPLAEITAVGGWDGPGLAPAS